MQAKVVVLIFLMLAFLQPVYANGGHIHVEGIFFLLLGSLVFLGSLGMVIYFLLRPDRQETDERSDQE